MSEDQNQDKIRQELAADGSEAGVELEAYNPFPFDADKISISDKRVPFETLTRRLKQNTIQAPSIQRGAGLWGNDQQSRLIESLMLKIPVPLFYVAEEEDVVWKVVDGLQRITAIKRYVINQEFALSGLEFLNALEGCKFDQLPQKFQTRILETEFQFAIINPSTPQNVQRNVFKRLNTGGLPLTLQEIRHALYYGPSADLLSKLVKSKEFKKTTTGSINDSRMAGRELILRFFAFFIRGIESYPKNEDMDGFLSETMQIINLMPELDPKDLNHAINGETSNLTINYRTHEELEKYFTIAMNRAYTLFGEYSFRKSVPGRWKTRTPINKALFETWSVILSELKTDKFQLILNNKKRFYSLLEAATYESITDELAKYISRDSHKYQGVLKRYKIFKQIIDIAIGEYNLEGSLSLIKKEYRITNALKKILNNEILEDTKREWE